MDCSVNLKECSHFEEWLICEATGENYELIKKMKKNEDGSYPVVLTVGGIELDFHRAAKCLEKQLDDLVAKRAQKLLSEKYGDLLGEIMSIQERIENQRELFQYEWEREDNGEDTVRVSGSVRQFDDLGRISIPKDAREKAFGTSDVYGKTMEIFYKLDGTIILKPY